VRYELSFYILIIRYSVFKGLREEHRLKTFEKRVLKIFGPKRDEVTGGWRKLNNEELHNLYSLPSIIRIIKKDEIGRVCSTNAGEEECM
jgi:hypothetical protein